MAFTNSPQNNTYRTEQIMFDGEDNYRSGSTASPRDIQITNFYYDRISQENEQKDVRLKKRPGLGFTTYDLSKVLTTDPIRGSFYDVTQNAFYWAVKDKVYVCYPDGAGTSALVTTLSTINGFVGFCSFLKSDNTAYTLFSDGIDLWVHNFVAATCTKVTDPDMPTPHQPYPVYIDGYVLLVKVNTSDVYNCDTDDPFTWTAGNFFTAEISADYAIRVKKAKNYVVVFGQDSIEYFYDAGNATGTPFSRNESPFRGVGYVTGMTTIGDTTYFVGQERNQNLGVYMLNSFKVERISNPAVERTLQANASTANTKGQVTLGTDAHCISTDGHNFYTLVTPQNTWLYDIEEKIWYEWKDTNAVGLQFEAVWNMVNGQCFVALANQTNIAYFSPTLYQDFNANFTCRYQTKDFNAGTMHWKFMDRAMLMCDQPAFSGVSNATLSWSDDDWSNVASMSKQINILSASPYTKRLGKFRTRSFRIDFRANYPLRMTGLEVSFNVGAH